MPWYLPRVERLARLTGHGEELEWSLRNRVAAGIGAHLHKVLQDQLAAHGVRASVDVLTDVEKQALFEEQMQKKLKLLKKMEAHGDPAFTQQMQQTMDRLHQFPMP